MPNVKYDQLAINELSDRTSYEVWLLEAVYTLTSEELFPVCPDDVIYQLGATHPIYGNSGRANLIFGDWRPGFLEAGAPLVFISTFKILDMFFEWVLASNNPVLGSSSSFSEKIKAIKKADQPRYPSLFEQRPWLRERIVALYENLVPLRGTVIHSRHFNSNNGELNISSSKNGSVGPEVQMSAQALRTFATLCISILRYVEAASHLGRHRENLLRWQLDQLTNLHRMPALGQKEPYKTTVRMFIEESDPRAVDVDRVSNDLAANFPQYSVVFDLRVLLTQSENVVAAYLFPSEILKNLEQLVDTSAYVVDVPADLDRHCVTRSTRPP